MEWARSRKAAPFWLGGPCKGRSWVPGQQKPWGKSTKIPTKIYEDPCTSTRSSCRGSGSWGWRRGGDRTAKGLLRVPKSIQIKMDENRGVWILIHSGHSNNASHEHSLEVTLSWILFSGYFRDLHSFVNLWFRCHCSCNMKHEDTYSCHSGCAASHNDNQGPGQYVSPKPDGAHNHSVRPGFSQTRCTLRFKWLHRRNNVGLSTNFYSLMCWGKSLAKFKWEYYLYSCCHEFKLFFLLLWCFPEIVYYSHFPVFWFLSHFAL